MSNDLLYSISKEDVQYLALNEYGRELSEEELIQVEKGLMWGLNSGLDIVFNTIFSDILKMKKVN